MPKAVPIISPFHNLSAGDVADQLGAVKAEIADLEDRERNLRDELIRRGGAEIDGTLYRATITELDDRCQGRPLRDGRAVVERPLPASAGDDGCRQGARRRLETGGI